MAPDAPNVLAFGDNVVNGCPCPAMAAGLQPANGGHAATMAEEYDAVVLDRYGIDEGTLPREIAESCWEEAIERLHEKLGGMPTIDDTYRDEIHWIEDDIEVGEKVTARVF